MKRTLIVLCVSLVFNHVYAQDMSKGHTFTDGDTVHAADLNALVDSATILSTFYSGKGSGTPLTTDNLLFYQASTSTIKKVTVADLMTAGNAVNTSTVRAASSFLAGPTSGSPAAPTFRFIMPIDTARGTNAAASSTTIDCGVSYVFYRVLTANTSYTFANFPDGGVVTVAVQQAATGGPYNATFPGVRWKGTVAPTMSTAANRIDLYTFINITGSVLGSSSQNY